MNLTKISKSILFIEVSLFQGVLIRGVSVHESISLSPCIQGDIEALVCPLSKTYTMYSAQTNHNEYTCMNSYTQHSL